MNHPIDYAVYQHIHNQTTEFMDYLKEINCQVLVKPYALRFEYTATIIEEIIQQRTLLLQKQGEVYRCTIDGAYFGESQYASMAVCLAVLDVYSKKEFYETEAQLLVKADIEGIQKRKEELERKLNQ